MELPAAGKDSGREASFPNEADLHPEPELCRPDLCRSWTGFTYSVSLCVAKWTASLPLRRSASLSASLLRR